jgi:CheY-like chemotaxis protein
VFHSLHSALIVAPSPPPASPAPVILLAEDEENNIYTLSTYLEAKGYQVVLARNGAEALSRADDAKPALILMDIQMPDMDGLEAIQRIRADTALSQVPIIALTALAMPGDRERCLAAGADEYLTKPVSLKGLVRAIEAHLQQPAASAEAIYDAY